MKKVSTLFFLLVTAGVLFISCKNGSGTKTETGNDTTVDTSPVQKMDYPYTIKHPDNWEIGNQQNTLIALSALKAWENKNLDETLGYFADSVQVRFDGISKTVSKDTLRSLITPDKMTKNIVVKMEDWQSSISKNKQDEWVSLWYTQYVENTNGSKDSIDVFNDLKLKDGKVIRLDEYRRKLH